MIILLGERKIAFNPVLSTDRTRISAAEMPQEDPFPTGEWGILRVAGKISAVTKRA
jgi:hypothetical protein